MAAFHNSRLESRENSAENSGLSVETSRPRRNPIAFKLAARLALRVGMVRTWPNIETIRLAIESEALMSGVSLDEAADVILKAAQEGTPIPWHRPPSDWVVRTISRQNDIDRFWFEDARWRGKDAYAEFQQRLEASA